MMIRTSLLIVCAAAFGTACAKTVPGPDTVGGTAAGTTPTAPDAAAAPVDDVAAATPGPDVAASSDVVAAGDAAAFDRAVRPTPGPIAALKLPVPERFTLDNGLEGYLLPTTTLPTVSMVFELERGAVDDPTDKVGLASVCLDLYSEGTSRLDKIAWSEALADHAVQIYSPAGSESSTVVMQALTSELEPALDLLAELLSSPGMRQEDFVRIIADRKAALAQSRGTAGGVAARLWSSLVWGAEHPYGSVQMEAHLDAMTLDDCKAWVAQLKPVGMRLWVAGKVGKDELTAALNKRLASWTGEAPKRREIPPAPAPVGTIFAVHVPGSVQSMVYVGHPGPLRSAPDYEPTFMMAQIFGGTFSSRVNMNLREAKGYAYGSRGGFSYRRAGSTMSVSASVEASTTALSLREVRSELDKMRAEPPSMAELARDRDGALLALPARFAKAGSTLEELRTLMFYGLPLDWFAGYQERLKAVDPAAVHAAAKQHLAPGELVVLVAGDLSTPAKDAGGKTIKDELQKLADDKVFGAGGLVVLDADGKRL